MSQIEREEEKEKKGEGKREILRVIVFVIVIVSFVVLSVFVVIPMVSAAPPTSQQFSTGYTLSVPQDDFLKAGQSFQFDFHIYNISNGVPINSGISCEFHLYNSSGDHIYEASASSPADGIDYEFPVAGTNFTSPNTYYYFVSCNSSTLGGFGSDVLTVTTTGIPTTTFQGIIDLLLWLTTFAVFVGLLIMGIKLPGYNNSDAMTGYVISINNMKYVKMFCIAFAYLTALFIAYLSWQLAYAYLVVPVLAMVFYDIFIAMAIATLPLFIVGMFILIANIVRDGKIKDMLTRGLQVKGE